jgi:uncharacterized protein YjbJ (UPF0337 family)
VRGTHAASSSGERDGTRGSTPRATRAPVSSAVEAETIMNAQTIEGNWTQFKGKIREQWGKLTDDDVDIIAGKREQLIGKIKERYGKSTDVVDREIKEFEARHQKSE